MATETGGLTNTPMLEQVFVNPDHSSQVLYQLSELWRDKKLCDATIEVGPVKVYVHRLVLLAACPYLLTVGGQHEVSILEVKLPMTVGLEGLNIFLTYLYDGVLHLTSANLRSVEKLTKILKVTSIQKFCQEFRDSNKETGTADKITTDYSLKMTNSSLQIIFSEIQNEMKRESAEPEIEPTPSKRPRMNLDKLSAALQKKSSQSDVVKDSGRGHSVSGGNSISNVASSGPSEIQHDDRDKSVDPLLMHVKEEPMSDYDDEDDTSFSEDTSESQGYSGTTDFVRQAPYDTRPFPDEEAVSRGSKMVVALPPPPSLQKRPSLKRKSFHPSAQHTSQTSETDSGGVNEDVNPGDIGTSGEGGVDATKVLKNIVKSMPEMAMNLGTSSEIGEDNKPSSTLTNQALRRRRNDLSLAQKYEVINLLDQKLTQTEISVRLKCSASTISRIASKKDEIRTLFKTNLNKQRKRQRTGSAKDIEAALTKWFHNAKSSGIPISGPILMEKAKEISIQLNYDNFSASSGWLSRWKVRNSVFLKRHNKEKKDTDTAACDVSLNDDFPEPPTSTIQTKPDHTSKRYQTETSSRSSTPVGEGGSLT